MKREVIGWLIATRSGHGEVTDTPCICEQRRAHLHSFSCRLGGTHRTLLQCKKMSFNLSRSWEAPKVWPFLRSGHLLLGSLTGITGTQTGRNRVLWIERKYIFNVIFKTAAICPHPCRAGEKLTHTHNHLSQV